MPKARFVSTTLTLLLICMFIVPEVAFASDDVDTAVIFSDEQMINTDPLIQELDEYYAQHPGLLENLIYCDEEQFYDIWNETMIDFHNESVVAQNIFDNPSYLQINPVVTESISASQEYVPIEQKATLSKAATRTQLHFVANTCGAVALMFLKRY